MDGAAVCHARGCPDLARGHRRPGRDPAREPAVASPRPGRGRTSRAARGFPADRSRRDHEFVGGRAGRAAARDRPRSRPPVPRQRDDRAAGLRLRAREAARADVRVFRGDCGRSRLADVLPGAARGSRGPAGAGIGHERGEIRPARCRPVPFVRGRRRRVLRRAHRFRGCAAQRVPAARIGRPGRSRGRRDRNVHESHRRRHALRDALQRAPLRGGARPARFSRHSISRARHPGRGAARHRRHAGSRHQADAGAVRLLRAVRYRPAAVPRFVADHGAAPDPDRRAVEPVEAAPGPLHARRLRDRRVFRLLEFAVVRQSLAGEGTAAAADRRLVGSFDRVGARPHSASRIAARSRGARARPA